MSSSSHGHTANYFETSDSWLSHKHPKTSNALKAVEDISHNVIDALAGTSSRYIADITNQFHTAWKNLIAFREKGWNKLPRGVVAAMTNTVKGVTNALTGLVHGADRVVTKGVNDSIVDASSGTLDRIPFLGKAIGNICKLGGGVLNAPTRFFSWVTKNLPDRIIDTVNDTISLVKPTRHLSYARGGSNDVDNHH